MYHIDLGHSSFVTAEAHFNIITASQAFRIPIIQMTGSWNSLIFIIIRGCLYWQDCIFLLKHPPGHCLCLWWPRESTPKCVTTNLNECPSTNMSASSINNLVRPYWNKKWRITRGRLTSSQTEFIQRTSGGRLNKKDGLTRYGNSHVKDKTS